jgi:hypothetical protein
MADNAAVFFDSLAQRGPRILPERYAGSIRFDLAEGERTQHWRMTFEAGNVTVSRDTEEADCVLQASFHVFDELVSGGQSLPVALIRGELNVDGDLRLLGGFRKLLPGPPGAHDPRSLAPERRRKQ